MHVGVVCIIGAQDSGFFVIIRIALFYAGSVCGRGDFRIPNLLSEGYGRVKNRAMMFCTKNEDGANEQVGGLCLLGYYLQFLMAYIFRDYRLGLSDVIRL